MGYAITIGELDVRKYPENGLDSDCIRFDAVGVKVSDSPAFGEPTDFTNSRWPMYSTWSDFLQAVGLYGVFFDEQGHLIGGHPGVRLVTQELADRVSQALDDYRAMHPSAIEQMEGGDGWLCRLVWLSYWLRWALANCDTPVIANS